MMTSYEFFAWLVISNGYSAAKPLPGRPGRYGAIVRLLMHYSIVVGEIGDMGGYEDRWCYSEDFDATLAAFDAWDGTGEPAGWRRHPASGRRFTPAGEMYVNP